MFKSTFQKNVWPCFLNPNFIELLGSLFLGYFKKYCKNNRCVNIIFRVLCLEHCLLFLEYCFCVPWIKTWEWNCCIMLDFFFAFWKSQYTVIKKSTILFFKNLLDLFASSPEEFEDIFLHTFINIYFWLLIQDLFSEVWDIVSSFECISLK